MQFLEASRFLIRSLKSSLEFSCSNKRPIKNSSSCALLSLATSRSPTDTTANLHISASWTVDVPLPAREKLIVRTSCSRFAFLRKVVIFCLRLKEWRWTRKWMISVEGRSWLRRSCNSVLRVSKCSLRDQQVAIRLCRISQARLAKIVSTPLLLFIIQILQLTTCPLSAVKAEAPDANFKRPLWRFQQELENSESQSLSETHSHHQSPQFFLLNRVMQLSFTSKHEQASLKYCGCYHFIESAYKVASQRASLTKTDKCML